jgi:uncharacterized peroxidase-related enzyme
MTYKMQNLPIHSVESAPEKAKPILDGARKKLGFVPNMYGAMANEPALLDAYVTGYNAFHAESGLSPVEQEVVFLIISRENACTYCVAAHSVVADMMSKVPPEVTNAIRDGRAIGNEKLQALARFVAVMVATRGNPGDADVAAFTGAGYAETNILGIVLAISVKIISNYSNHVFHTPLDAAFAGRTWKSSTP